MHVWAEPSELYYTKFSLISFTDHIIYSNIVIRSHILCRNWSLKENFSSAIAKLQVCVALGEKITYYDIDL